jgi:hypothetical protein
MPGCSAVLAIYGQLFPIQLGNGGDRNRAPGRRTTGEPKQGQARIIEQGFTTGIGSYAKPPDGVQNPSRMCHNVPCFKVMGRIL